MTFSLFCRYLSHTRIGYRHTSACLECFKFVCILFYFLLVYCVLVVCDIGNCVRYRKIPYHYYCTLYLAIQYISRYIANHSACAFTGNTCTTGVLEVQYSMVHDTTHAEKLQCTMTSWVLFSMYFILFLACVLCICVAVCVCSTEINIS